ncbi:MAG TPA: glucose 1-dehydrogenase [Stellaceae bacterium]|jgi:NAD(P)-dependent dehydrogenase (short-subunit alcohol dehydrogenase family)
MEGFTGKVAIVTGGARGIGAATVRAFRDAGAHVVAADIDEAAGAALAAELAPAVLFQRADVASDEDLRAAVAAAVDTFGGIDFVVNAAATMEDAGFGSTREQWRRGLDVNLVGAAILLREAAPHIRRRGGGGAIIHLGSIAGKFGQSGRAIYPVTKAALQQMTRSAAMELAPDRIRVNTVSPGWTWTTPIVNAAGGDRAKADRIAADYHPLGRVADAEEVARAILFLCSDEARFITGIDLPVDGGYAITGPDGGKPAMRRLAEE